MLKSSEQMLRIMLRRVQNRKSQKTNAKFGESAKAMPFVLLALA